MCGFHFCLFNALCGHMSHTLQPPHIIPNLPLMYVSFGGEEGSAFLAEGREAKAMNLESPGCRYRHSLVSAIQLSTGECVFQNITPADKGAHLYTAKPKCVGGKTH